MSTKKIAIASTFGAFAVLALLLAFPSMAASTTTSQNPNARQLLQNPRVLGQSSIQLSSGQTITLTSVAGGYRELGNPNVNGTASGTMTLQVTGVFKGGYSLSVTAGSLVVNGVTYTISSGSAEMGPRGAIAAGQGQAGTAQFLFLGRDLGKFGNTSYGILNVDLKDGTSEFGARLLVTISA
jgi:hypothetical protein